MHAREALPLLLSPLRNGILVVSNILVASYRCSQLFVVGNQEDVQELENVFYKSTTLFIQLVGICILIRKKDLASSYLLIARFHKAADDVQLRIGLQFGRGYVRLTPDPFSS